MLPFKVVESGNGTPLNFFSVPMPSGDLDIVIFDGYHPETTLTVDQLEKACKYVCLPLFESGPTEQMTLISLLHCTRRTNEELHKCDDQRVH